MCVFIAHLFRKNWIFCKKTRGIKFYTESCISKKTRRGIKFYTESCIYISCLQSK
jgi:hypothetical protein